METMDRELNTPGSPMLIRLQEFFDARQRKPELNYDSETELTSISMSSVYELLEMLKFFKKK